MTPPLLIGVSARIHHPEGKALDLGGVFTKTLHYLEQSVAHWVMSSNVLVVMIPVIESEGMVKRSDMRLSHYADALDGLMLQGGADIAPASYGEDPLHPDWRGDGVRDRYEIELFNAFVEKAKPVLGICRGCQLINVALGGTLYQDIASQLPHAINHRDADKYERNFHALEFVEPSTLADLYPGRQNAIINTIHHQAVKRLGHDLVVEAVSLPDRIIEAVRWTGPSYVLGVQWHPEFLYGTTDGAETLDGAPLLEHFLAAVRQRKFPRAAHT
jgi:putative glutamine amidotransferase